MAEPEWITGPELARRLGVSAETVYKMARAGALPGGIYIGRRLVVNYTAFVARTEAQQPAHHPSGLPVPLR